MFNIKRDKKWFYRKMLTMLRQLYCIDQDIMICCILNKLYKIINIKVRFLSNNKKKNNSSDRIYK